MESGRHAGSLRSSFAYRLSLQHALLEQVPDITELRLPVGVYETAFLQAGFSKLLNLQSLKLDATRLERLPKLPSSIRHLQLIATSIDFRRLENSPVLGDYPLHELETLDLTNNHRLTYPALKILLNPAKGKIKVLELSCCGQIDKVAVHGLCTSGYLDGIVDLRLAYSDVDDQTAETLAVSCPKLRRLSLACTKITGVGVKALVQKSHGAFEELFINHCAGVSIDAVAYAKAHGINVSFRFPDNVKYGKRIRLG